MDSQSDRRTKVNNRFGLNSLVDIVGLGKFKVLIQGKNLGDYAIWASEPDPHMSSIVSNLPFPFMQEGHMPLLDGRYPGNYSDVYVDDIWQDVIDPNH